MNINDYDIEPVKEEKLTRVEYVRPDYGLEERYIPQSIVSIKGRKDFRGVINSFEDGNVIIKMFNETYAVPPQSFDSIFYLHPREPQNWYEKIKK